MSDASAAMQPTRPGERDRALDFVRGTALLGIGVVNGAFFFTPFMHAVHPPVAEWDSWVVRGTWFVNSALFQGKFIALFSLLFGLGLAMQLERAAAAGQKRWRFAMRRLLVLAGLGLAHAILIWYGDILFAYSLTAWIVVFTSRLPDRWVGRLAVLALCVMPTCLGSVIAVQQVFPAAIEALQPSIPSEPADAATATASASTAPPPRGWAAMVASMGDPNNPAWIEAEIVAMQAGPPLDRQLFRSANWGYVILSWPMWGFHSAGMMLVGAWLWRKRATVPGSAAAAVLRPLRTIGLLVGLPVSVIGTALLLSDPMEEAQFGPLGSLLFVVGMSTLPLAYFPILLGMGRALRGWFVQHVAAIGRMCLTAYIGTSLVAAFIAEGWGLGYFGRMSFTTLTLIPVAIWVGWLVVCQSWLNRHSFGPLEWLWRRLEYGRRGDSTVD